MIPIHRSRARTAVDLLYEAAASLACRPSRTVLTSLAIALGVGTLVATVGISITAGNQISDALQAARPTSLQIARNSSGDEVRVSMLPWDVEERLRGLTGVVAAGAYGLVAGTPPLVSSAPFERRGIDDQVAAPTFAVSPGLQASAGLRLAAGRPIDAGDVAGARPVAVVGGALARRLELPGPDLRPAVYLGDEIYTVVGVIGQSDDPQFMDAVLVPYSTATRRHGESGPSSVVVLTQPGAVGRVGRSAPFALLPSNPTSLTVRRPPDLTDLRREIEADIDGLYLALSLLTVLAGAIAMANASLGSVLERTPELGLRRALGASRRTLATQLLVENGLVGLCGAVVGGSAGIAVVVVAAVLKDWTATLDPVVPLLAGLVGVGSSLLASIPPVRRAARIVPAEALRS